MIYYLDYICHPSIQLYSRFYIHQLRGNKLGVYTENCIPPYSCVHIFPETMLKIVNIIYRRDEYY
jgi:hypothetical protein